MQLIRAIKQFLSHCRHSKKLSDHTVRAYSIDLNEFRRFLGREILIEDCDRDLIRDYLQYLFEERNLKETSVKRRMACLKSMFNWLETESVIASNPFHRLSLKIKLPTQLPRALTRTELNNLLKTPLNNLGFNYRNSYSTNDFQKVVSSRKGFIQLTTLVSLELLFATGARVGELTQVSISDIDLDEATVRIKGKGNRERQVFLPDEKIRTLIGIYINTRSQFSPSTSILLINTRGTAASTQLIRLLMRKAGEQARLTRRTTPHMMRHSTATHLLNAGVDIRHVQRLLGHQSIMTTQIYTHVSDDQLKQVICKTHPINEIMEK